MKQSLIFLFGVISCGVSAISAPTVDLRPKYETRIFDGVVFRQPYFTDGSKKYGVITDGETEIGETATGAVFRFRTFPFATVTLAPSPLRTDLSFGAENQPRYLQAAKAMLPPEAENIVLDTVVPEPLPMNGWHSCRFLFSYTTPEGSKMSKAITFLNLTPEQQIVIQSTSREKVKDEIFSRADDIISRWFEITPGQNSGN